MNHKDMEEKKNEENISIDKEDIEVDVNNDTEKMKTQMKMMIILKIRMRK